MQLIKSKQAQLASLLAVLLLSGGSTNWLVAAQDGSMLDLTEPCPDDWKLTSPYPCEFTAPGYLAYLDYQRYYLNVNVSEPFDLAITVSSTQGDVDIQLLSPNGTLLASSSERIGDDVVQATRTTLARYPPGSNYTLVLQAVAQSESWYIVRIQGTTAVTLLAPEDRAVVSAIASQCCPPDDDLLPDSCTTLLAATSVNATQQDDLCSQPPNMCNAQGHLTKLVLSGGDRGNFVCPSLPAEVGKLSALQVLDWTSNGQVGTLASVASVLAPLAPSLKRLYFGRNSLAGPLGCELVAGTALEVLRLERNLLTGTVPPCLFQSPALKHLSLPGNLLRGPIPELPPNAGLRLIDLSENGPPLGVWPGNPGMQGKLPDFSRAINLTYLNLQSNSLTGTIPPLPAGLQVLQLSYNGLVGPLPPSLESAGDLRVLDLSRNQLTGGLSTKVSGSSLLTVLRLAGNKLGGPLPDSPSGWGAYLMDVDLSENSFTATAFSELLSRRSLLKLNLAVNSLAFDLALASARLPVNNSLLYFNVSYNALYGNLSAAPLGRMLLFNKLLGQAVQDDEALQGSLPPNPLFDISNNVISSTFPIQLLPLLAQRYLDWYMDPTSPDQLQLSIVLQPQKPPGGLVCPLPATSFPDGTDSLDELQQLYDLSCMSQLGQRINISSFHSVTISRPPRRPAPPRPPPLPPTRPGRRLPPLPPSPPGANNSANGSANSSTNISGSASDSGTSSSGSQSQTPPGGASSSPPSPYPSPPSSSSSGAKAADRSGSSAQGAAVEGQGAADNAQQQQSAPASSGQGGGGKGGGASVGAIAGGVVGGLLAVAAAAAVVGLLLYRRNKTRRNAYASKRVPLTFNSAYEAPSEGTASNYGDMQMFEFKLGDRPPRHRTRL